MYFKRDSKKAMICLRPQEKGAEWGFEPVILIPNSPSAPIPLLFPHQPGAFFPNPLPGLPDPVSEGTALEVSGG